MQVIGGAVPTSGTCLIFSYGSCLGVLHAGCIAKDLRARATRINVLVAVDLGRPALHQPPNMGATTNCYLPTLRMIPNLPKI